MINKLHLAMIELYRGDSKRILSGSTWEWDSSEGCCFSIDQSILRIKQHRTGKTGGSDHYVTE